MIENVSLANIIIVAVCAFIMLGMTFFYLYKTIKARPNISVYEKEHDQLVYDLIDTMHKEFDFNEERFRNKVEDISDNAYLRIKSYFAANLACYVCKKALAFNLANTLFKAGRKNNFAKMLDKRMYVEYQKDLLAKIRSRHIKQHGPVKAIRCTITEYFPVFEDIADFLESVVTYWTSNMLIEFTNLNKMNLEVCYRYKQKFIDDKYWSSRINVHIQKFQDVLNNLEKRLVSKQVFDERRAN